MESSELLTRESDGRSWDWYFARLSTKVVEACDFIGEYPKLDEALGKAIAKGFPIDFEGRTADRRKKSTLMEVALNADFLPIPAVRSLLRAGANINKIHGSGQTVLTRLCHLSSYYTWNKENPKTSFYLTCLDYEKLLEEVVGKMTPEDINKTDKRECTALDYLIARYIVSYMDNRSHIKLLLDHGADPADENDEQKSFKFWKRFGREPTVGETKRMEEIQNFISQYLENRKQLETTGYCWDYEL